MNQENVETELNTPAVNWGKSGLMVGEAGGQLTCLLNHCKRWAEAAGVATLGQVVELAGPQLQDSAGLALKLGFRSRRVTKLLLDHWRKRLSGHELLMLDAFSSGEATVNRQDYFPLIQLSLDLKDCAGLLLDRCPQASLQEASGKTFYHLMKREKSQAKMAIYVSRKRRVEAGETVSPVL
ncbi:uncharacterized protein AKAME5_002561400, partial [Lates japonicus]